MEYVSIVNNASKHHGLTFYYWYNMIGVSIIPYSYYLSIFHTFIPSKVQKEIIFIIVSNDLLVLNVGNGWVAGGCWDDYY